MRKQRAQLEPRDTGVVAAAAPHQLREDMDPKQSVNDRSNLPFFAQLLSSEYSDF